MHSQSDTPCPKRSANESAKHDSEGIGLAQEKRLRSRKRCNRTEEEKWREVYMICFPEATSAPNPCKWRAMRLVHWDRRVQRQKVLCNIANRANHHADFEVPSGQSSELVLYEDFMRRELAKRVRAELESRLEQQWIPIEESLKGQLVEISRDIQLKLLDEFKMLRQKTSPSADGLEVDEPNRAVSASSKRCVSVETPAAGFSSANPLNSDYNTANAPRGYSADGIETPASSFCSENQPANLYEALENPRDYIIDEIALGNAPVDEHTLNTFTLPQRYFEDTDWAEPADFLDGLQPRTGDWRNNVFANPADTRLVSAPAVLFATASLRPGNGQSLVEDSTFWPFV